MAEPIQTPTPNLSQASLAEIAKLAAEKKLPPVDKWNPAHCGHSDMRIAADGTWFYRGTPLGRPAMMKLFSTVLRREPDGSFVLVTPVEKLTIDVDDAPFVAVEVTSEGDGAQRTLAFRLNTDDVVVAGPANPLRLTVDADGAPRPYLHVRGPAERPLEALVNRACFYQLADWALEESPDAPALYSGGAHFAFAG